MKLIDFDFKKAKVGDKVIVVDSYGNFATNKECKIVSLGGHSPLGVKIGIDFNIYTFADLLAYYIMEDGSPCGTFED